mmetsp:Transcript_7586/g.12768  ORF Transcript_7586/g.12768 Transcript_7586/m.12768 type:complete len:318 (-) Transcript_7586:37-990(-)
MVHSDEVISVSGKQGGTISRPGEASAMRNLGVLAHGGHVNLDFINHALGLQVPDLDGLGGGGAQPVAVGREDKGVDHITSIQRVESLALSQVPKDGSTVLATGGAQGAIGRHSNGVQVSTVTLEVGAELAVGQRPDLDKLVPASRHNDGGSQRRRELDARHPLSVAFLDNGELALTKSVPKLHGLVARTRDNLSVVSREGNRQDVLGVTNEAASATAVVDVPQTKGGIPRSGQSELTIRRDNNIRDEMVVSVKGALRVAVVTFLTGEGPHEASLVSGRRQDHVGVLRSGSNGSDPAVVAGQSSAKSHLFTHVKKLPL